MESRYGERAERMEKEGRKESEGREAGRSRALFNLSRSVDRAESSASWIGG